MKSIALVVFVVLVLAEQARAQEILGPYLLWGNDKDAFLKILKEEPNPGNIRLRNVIQVNSHMVCYDVSLQPEEPFKHVCATLYAHKTF
jgi:hypothetical protein